MPSHDLVSFVIALFCHDGAVWIWLVGFTDLDLPVLILLGLLHLGQCNGMLQNELWRR
jgi:hypothetical protein